MLKIVKLLLENIPEIKKRGWVFSLIWKVFRISKVKDISEIWTNYRSLKSNSFEIPNLGLVRLRENLRFDGNILNTTVSRIADKWFISFGVEASLSYLPCKNQASVGIDLGIKTLATLSNGTLRKFPICRR